MYPRPEPSALDNDLYKFTMQQAVLHHYPDAWVKYKFKCRNPKTLNNVDVHHFVTEIGKKITEYCKVRFTPRDLLYLSSIRFMKKDYIDFLEDFTFKQRYITLKATDSDIQLYIEGPWIQTILFEVPLLAIVSETYSEIMSNIYHDSISGIDNVKKLLAKAQNHMNDKFLTFADFGTRRRFTKIHQYLILEMLAHTPNLAGTSNVEFAKQFNIKPIGTMAHEWLQAHQSLTRVIDSQKAALEVWAKEYRGDLGIALSDVVGFDAFLKDFDSYFAKLFDGCRHDSGDPFKWCNKLIKHYENMGIDPKTKHAVFSDGLTFDKAVDILSTFQDKINVSFGIGTFLTNNCGMTPLQIVIKMIECNGKPVAKISDSKGKGMCEDESYLRYLKKTFNVKK